MQSIFTLTLNPAIDQTIVVDRVLPEHKLRAEEQECDPGGGGLNVARVVNELGGDVTAAWTRGGTTGTLLEILLDRAGLKHVALPIAEPVRQNITVLEQQTNAQYRFVFPGPELSADEAAAIVDFVAGWKPVPGYLVLSGSLPPGVPDDYYVQLSNQADPSTRIVLDTSGAALAAMRGHRAFLIKPNLNELSRLVESELETDVAIVEAARSLIAEATAEVVLVSMGARGAVIVTRDDYQLIVAPPVKPASRVGAGDSMVGGLVTALARGDDLFDAARYGLAAGAAAVMSPGTQLSHRADVERLYRSMKVAVPARAA